MDLKDEQAMKLSVEDMIDSIAKSDPILGQLLVDKYRVDSLIGSGNSADVYKAHSQMIKRPVAIKVLSQHLDEKTVVRFKTEVSAAFGLAHRNLCAVHDYGLTPDHRLFLVMDYVDGMSLTTLLKERGKLELADALELTIQICEGLTAAHEKGIVHRDIKPSNIMLQQDGAKMTPRVVDFGIAKVDTENKTLTGTGELIGTPQYMSPEQCQGQKLDARSDIYSLACVLFELATGAPLFTGENAIAILMRHVQEEPPTVQSKLGRQPHVQSLDAVLGKALAKDCADRYESMQAFCEDLRKVLRGEQVAMRKKRVLNKSALVACGAIALLVVAGLFTWQRMPAKNDRSATTVGMSARISGGTGDPNDAQSWYSLGWDLDHAGMHDKAERAFRTALQLDPAYGDAWYHLSLVLMNRNEYKGAEAAARKAIGLNKSDPQYWFALADVLDTGKRYAEAEAAFREALSLRPDFLDVQERLIANLRAQHKYRQADIIEHRRETAPSRFAQ